MRMGMHTPCRLSLHGSMRQQKRPPQHKALQLPPHMTLPLQQHPV